MKFVHMHNKINNHLIFFLLIFFATGCALKENSDGNVYSRTKDIGVSGQISVSKGEAMLSVTWKYAKQTIAEKTMKQHEELQDCFKSEIFYNGIKDGSVLFLVKNYICSSHTPINIEPVILSKKLPARITFHSKELKILLADSKKLVFESH